MKYPIFLLTILFFLHSTVCATTLAQGNALSALSAGYSPSFPNPSATTLTFSQPVTVQALDHATGTLYVGLGNDMPHTTTANTIAPAGPYTVSKVVRANGSSTPIFVPIATNQTFFPSSTPVGIDFLALAAGQAQEPTNLAIVTANPNAYLQQPAVIVSSSDGTKVQGYSKTRAFDPALGENAGVTGGIVQLAANQDFIFAATRPPTQVFSGVPVTVDFGNATAPPAPSTATYTVGSGIAVLGINPLTLLPTQVPAQPYDPGIKAAQLDQTIPQVAIQGTPSFVPNRVSLYWDEPLERLYAGLQLATAGPGTIHLVSTVTTCNTIACPELSSFIDGVAFITQSCIDLVASSSCLIVTTDDFGVTTTECNLLCNLNQSLCDALIMTSTCLILTNIVTPVLSPRGGDAGDGAMSVVVASLSSQGALTMNRFMPGNVLVNDDTTKIVGVRQVVDKPLNLAATHLKVMHTTTGASYLILNGGNGSITNNAFGAEGNYLNSTISTVTGTIGNMVFALPLVDVGDPSDPTQGVLANKNDFNSDTKRFETPAVNLPDLTTSSDPQALVGAGPLPVQPSTPIAGAGGGVVDPFNDESLGIDTFDLAVVGDAVYVALANMQTATLDDTGVFYSQAMFDETGQIIRWTPWSKRALPFNAFSNLPVGNTVRFVAVDPVTGKLWAVDGYYRQAVITTAWDNGQFLSPLPKAVNTALPQGCFSVLDLDQSTVGLGAATQDRYALFGGVNTVAFAITTTSMVPFAPFNITGNGSEAPQGVITDFSSTSTFLVTQLPSAQGASVNALEYSRQVAGTPSNYFFAGTDAGLYVFSNGGNGFDVATLNAFNLFPFAGGGWQLAPNIVGAVIDVKTTGNALYVLTMQTLKSGSVSTLYSMQFATTLSAMFANPAIIAQSGIFQPGSDLSNTLEFYGIQIVSTADDGSTEQLVLATNNGLFMSTASGGIQQSGLNQVAALWTPIAPDNNATQYFGGIAGMDTPNPSTVWPLRLQDPTGLGLYNRGSVYQLSGGDTDPFEFVPVPFNADLGTPPFQTFDQVNYFWCDGGRRFFVVSPSGNESIPKVDNRVLSLPYNVTEWNVNAPTDLTDYIVNDISKIYWIKHIGATGILMAGTDRGVVALE